MTKFADVKSRVGDKCYCHNLSGDLTCFVCWEAMNTEITRLREENADLLATVKSYQKGTIEQIEREKRLREAIENEAEIHAQHRHPGDVCSCEICQIAREGK